MTCLRTIGRVLAHPVNSCGSFAPLLYRIERLCVTQIERKIIEDVPERVLDALWMVWTS